jgi:hypothetical protein
MITTFLTERGRLPWPYPFSYPLEYDSLEIDTEVEKNLRPWFVPGDTPPPEICDLLSASDFDFEFSFNSAVFNQRFDLLDENGEGGFPKDISFSRSIKAGTFLSKTKSQYGRNIYTLDEDGDIEETYNEEFAWNTRSKVLEAYTEDLPLGFGGFAGLQYQEFMELVLTDEETNDVSSAGYWSFYVAMSAPIPYKTFNLKKELVWTCNLPFIAVISLIRFFDYTPLGGDGPSFTVSYPYFLEGDKNYPIGSTYIDIESFGGQGEGQGGMFPSASISIKNHF